MSAAYHPRLHTSAAYLPCAELLRRAKLQVLFPGVPIQLDLYHWFARWDECIAVKTGTVLSNMFSSQMRDAVLTPLHED